jgi:hypothetical protein
MRIPACRIRRRSLGYPDHRSDDQENSGSCCRATFRVRSTHPPLPFRTRCWPAQDICAEKTPPCERSARSLGSVPLRLSRWRCARKYHSVFRRYKHPAC